MSLSSFGRVNVPLQFTAPYQAPILTVVQKQPIDQLNEISELTSEEKNILLSLKYLNSNELIINLAQREVFLEVIGMIKSMGFDATITYIATTLSPMDLIWNQPGLESARGNDKREREITKEPAVGIRGLGRCRRCGSDNLVFAQKQTRSADEGMTTFFRCLDCPNRWKE